METWLNDKFLSYVSLQCFAFDYIQWLKIITSKTKELLSGPPVIPCKFLPLIVPTWQPCQLLRCEKIDVINTQFHVTTYL
jgi:hypothetical protein